MTQNVIQENVLLFCPERLYSSHFFKLFKLIWRSVYMKKIPRNFAGFVYLKKSKIVYLPFFSFNASLSLSDGFQTFTSESLLIPDKI